MVQNKGGRKSDKIKHWYYFRKSTREGRVSPQVGEWVKGIADKRGDANYEIVDIADFKLPFLGTTGGDAQESQHGTKKLHL